MSDGRDFGREAIALGWAGQQIETSASLVVKAIRVAQGQRRCLRLSLANVRDIL